MGQFSWCCAVCDQEVMHGKHPGYQWTTDAVILWPNGDRRSGRYEDGYGWIAGIDLVEQHGGWRLAHQRCYETVMHKPTAELFESFGPERHAQDQGWWPGERLAVERYGEPDMSELTKEKTYVCYECRRTWKAKWSGGACPFGCKRSEDWKDYRELVEPFYYLDYQYETADGLIVCHNETHETADWPRYHEQRQAGTLDEDNPPTKIEPCFYFGEPRQARVSKPDDWDEMEPDTPFKIFCRGCKSTKVEVLTLERHSL